MCYLLYQNEIKFQHINTYENNTKLPSIYNTSSVILYPLLFGVGGHMSKDFPPAQSHKVVADLCILLSFGFSTLSTRVFEITKDLVKIPRSRKDPI